MSNVTVFVDFYLPGFAGGGPVRSVSNLVAALPDYEFTVVTRDRDAGDDQPYSHGRLDGPENEHIRYLPPNPVRLVRGLLRALFEDSSGPIYLNSFFSARFTILPLIILQLPKFRGRRVLLAPRGELSVGALTIRSWKKSVYLRFFRRFLLRRVDAFQATADAEKRFIESLFPGGTVVLLENLPVTIRPDVEEPIARDGLLYLGRVSEKKNILRVIEAYGRSGLDSKLVICGPSTDQEYMDQCLELARRTPGVILRPGVTHAQVGDVLRSASIFVHPSLDENFGHSIFEALAAGLPCIVGPSGHWSVVDGLAGRVVDPYSVEAISAAMQELGGLDRRRLNAMREKGREFAIQYASTVDLSVYRDFFVPTSRPSPK